MEIAARWPWFVSAGLAGVLNVMCQYFASDVAAPVASSLDLGAVAEPEVLGLLDSREFTGQGNE
jgi:hypothetical protein